MANKTDKTEHDDTEGFGVAPETASANDGANKVEKLDPVTNQPLTDFFPTVADEHADAVAAHMGAIKVGSNMGRHNAAAELVDIREADKAKREAADQALKTTEAANPIPEVQYAMIPPDVYRAREQARVMAQARTLRTNSIRPGGDFMVNGKRVDANGEAID